MLVNLQENNLAKPNNEVTIDPIKSASKTCIYKEYLHVYILFAMLLMILGGTFEDFLFTRETILQLPLC